MAKKLSKLDYKEIEEKEHNKFYHHQASNNDLTMIVGNLWKKISNTNPNSVSYEKWVQLLSVIAHKEGNLQNTFTKIGKKVLAIKKTLKN